MATALLVVGLVLACVGLLVRERTVLWCGLGLAIGALVLLALPRLGL